MIACVVDDKFFIAQYMVVDGVLSIFPPDTNGEILIEVESPVVTTSAMTPLPAVGSSPTLREASLVLDALYTINLFSLKGFTESGSKIFNYLNSGDCTMYSIHSSRSLSMIISESSAVSLKILFSNEKLEFNFEFKI